MHERRLFLIQDPQDDLNFPQTATPISALEYFIDDDPGPGNGIAIPVNVPVDLLELTDLMLAIDPGITPGIHTFSIRAKNESGTWSFVEIATFEVTNNRTPVFATSISSPTNVSEIPIDVSFGQEMTGFDVTDIITRLDQTEDPTLIRDGSFVDNANGDFSFIIDAVTEGEISVLIDAGAAQATSDGAVSLASDTLTIVYDITPPMVTVNALSTTTASPGINGTINDLTASVSVEIDGVSYNASINPDSTWSINPGIIASLAVGTYEVLVTATDLAGNVSTDGTSDELEILSTSPVPIISFSGGSITNQSPWNLAIDFGAEVTGFDQSDVITLFNEVEGTFVQDGSLVDNTNGNFSIVIEPIEGELSILIPADAATAVSDGNTSQASDTLRITYDITAPIVTVDSLTTTNTSPELSGTINDPSASVQIELDGNFYSASVNADSTWIVTEGTIVNLAPGTYDIIATVTDPAGNASNDGSSNELTVIANPLPVLSYTGDAITNQAPWNISIDFGVAVTGFEVADIVTLLNGNTGTFLVRDGSLTDNGNGNYSVIVDPSEGAVSTLIPASVALSVGDSIPSQASDTLRITYDTTAPVITINSLTTTEVSPELTGTINDLLATIEIEIVGNVYIPTINVDSTWIIPQGTIADLAIGTYDVLADATDPAGNVGTDASVDELEIIESTSLGVDPIDSLTLVAFYNSTNGDSWTNNENWLQQGQFVETWYGITVTEGRVTEINLEDDGSGQFFGNNLTGSLPANIEELTALENISLFFNDDLGGDFPATLINIPTLQVVRLGGLISGEVPSSLYEISTLTEIGLNSPNLTGSIPPTIGNLNLTWLDITSTSMDGPLPQELNNISSLFFVQINGNNFSGSVPGFSEATNLNSLNVAFNEFSDLPDFTNTSITSIEVGQNRFTFEDLEPNLSIISDDPTQKPFGTPQNIIISIDEDVTLEAATGIGDNDNYQWQKDGNPIDGATALQLTIANAAINDSGEYQLLITNSLFPSVTLESEPIMLTVVENIIEVDSFALVSLYNSTGGSDWTDDTNWTTGNVIDWFGVTLDAESNRVIAINLPENNLTGTIPPEIVQMDSLETLDLSGNNINNLETDFSGLTSVTSIDLSGNKLDFGDLEPVAEVPGLNYANQQDLDQAIDQGDLIIRSGTSQALTTTINGTLNLYQWTFDGEDIPGAIEASYAITDMDPGKVGTYGVKVSNSIVTGLTLGAPTIDVDGSAVISVNALDNDTNSPIGENINAYLFPLDENVGDTIVFGDTKGLKDESSTFAFPEVVFGNYYLAVESVVPLTDGNNNANPNATYVPTFYGNVFQSEEADILSLGSDTSLLINMIEFPEEDPPGEGLLSGTIEEDFGDDEARVDARRRAKRRKCGLRRRRTGGRTGQDDNFELFAYGETNDNGEFEFGFLPQGTYRFFVEYPGIPLDPDAEVEFEVGEAGVSDTEFVLAVFASPEGIEIEFILGITTDYFVDFKLYPNPTSSLITVEYAQIKIEGVLMELVDLKGNVHYSKELDRSNRKIIYDTGLLRSGQYFLRFTGGGNSEPLVYKIIKK